MLSHFGVSCCCRRRRRRRLAVQLGLVLSNIVADLYARWTLRIA